MQYPGLAIATKPLLPATGTFMRHASRFIPAAVLQHFECVTWLLATAVAGGWQNTRDVRIDVGAKMPACGGEPNARRSSADACFRYAKSLPNIPI
jgi:hypothetical protein